MFNEKQLQRFSIRKLTVGTASVLIGVSILTSWNINKVYADSRNVVSGESTAKNNNPQETGIWGGNPGLLADSVGKDILVAKKDNAQMVDNGSTEVSKSSDSNSSRVIKSDATKSDIVRDKTTIDDNSRTKVPEFTAQANNKKVVSDANRAKLTANDAQTKSAQQTAKSDAANSNTLVVQQTKKLTGNAKYKLADSKAQTDSNYSVTDNYPEGLMTYLPSDFDNKQEYAFEWLRNEINNNIILTTNRTGDGVVYVYQDGKKVGTYLAQNSSYTLHDTIVDDNWYYYHIEIGTVCNDNFAGIVQSNGYLLNIIYSLHAKDVDDTGSYYSTVSFFVPHKITQTVTYKDSNGNVIDSLTHTQDGLTGQSYTTGLPSGSDYVRPGEYLNTTHNGNGLISEFHDGYTCTKNYHDGVSVKFTENDSEKTGTGTMDYVIYDGDEAVQQGSLAYGQSTDYANDSGEYTIVNPYVPQTTNIVYQYKKLGNVVNIDPKGNTTTTRYTNDPNDPTKVEPINVPSIPGYTTKVNDKTVSDKTIMPADPGQDMYITYSADKQAANVIYRDVNDPDNPITLETSEDLTGKSDAKIDYDPTGKIQYYESQGYVLKRNDLKDGGVFDNDDSTNQTFYIDFIHKIVKVTQKDPDTVDPNSLSKDVTEHITYTGLPATETPAKVTHVLHFTGSGYLDKVTGKWTDKDGNKLEDQSLDKALEWTAQEGNAFDAVPSPNKAGYYVDRVDVKVGDQQLDKDTDEYSAYTDGKDVKAVENITHNHKNIVITVIYAPYQKAGLTIIDENTGNNLGYYGKQGGYNDKIEFGQAPQDIDNYISKGYVWDTAKTGAASYADLNIGCYDSDPNTDQNWTIYLKHGKVTVTPKSPGKSDEPINPNDPDGPKWPAGTDANSLTKTGTQTIHYVGAGDKTPADNTQTYTFIKSMVIDKVTGKVLDPGSWNIDSYTFGTVNTPVIPGYHADKAVAGGETVTPDDLNKVITVTYAPDGNPGNPSDHGDTPSPEPTPKPEPTPNPTTDDQPDSEISSDEHFENVKPKDKLDKTNPKKVDAYKKQRKIIKTKIAKQGHTEIAEPIEDKVTRENNVKVVSDPVENTAAEPTLPQTGETDNSIIGLLGMLLASFAAMFGFDSLHSHDKKHKN